MTDPTQSVHVRRVYYASGTPPVLPVLYDDSYDSLPNTDVLDPVLQYDGQRAVQGYTWDGTRQVADGESDPIGDALRADCVAYWKMDEASGPRADSANARNLTQNNTVGNAAGKVSNAAVPNPAAQSYLYSLSSDFHVTTTSYSWAGWVYMTSKASDVYAISKETELNNSEYSLAYSPGTDRLYCYVSDDSVSATLSADAFGSPPLNTWIFCVLWYDISALTINIQINNGTIDSVDASAVTVGNAAQLSIGTLGTATDVIWTGRMDELGFWKRLLTSDERSYLYNSGSGRTLYP